MHTTTRVWRVDSRPASKNVPVLLEGQTQNSHEHVRLHLLMNTFTNELSTQYTIRVRVQHITPLSPNSNAVSAPRPLCLSLIASSLRWSTCRAPPCATLTDPTRMGFRWGEITKLLPDLYFRSVELKQEPLNAYRDLFNFFSRLKMRIYIYIYIYIYTYIYIYIYIYHGQHNKKQKATIH